MRGEYRPLQPFFVGAGSTSAGDALVSTKSNGKPNSPDALTFDIEYLPTERIKLDKRNARRHPPGQVDQIGNSIAEFGFITPVVLNANDECLVGNGRVLAAKKRGIPTVPVIRVNHLTPAQMRAYAIADNRLTDNSRWDDRTLAEHLKELSELDLGFSLEVTGIPTGEIDLRIAGLEVEVAGHDSADDIPAPGIAVTRLGDMWKLGKHRVLCGDAKDESSYRTLMGDMRARVVITDPPYNVRISGHAGGKGKTKHREFVEASGELSDQEFVGFLRATTALMAAFSLDGAIHYVFMDWRHVADLILAGREVYSELKNLAVWVKPNAGMGSMYRSQHELVCVFKVGTARHRNNVELGRNGRHRTNVWECPGVTPFGLQTDEGNLLKLHPTVKPVRMLTDALMDCSARGDVVLDPFLGSGSTLIAAEKVGRVCYGMDLDPLYVDTVIRRWQAWTGEQAIHAQSGRTFDELQAESEKRHD